MEREIAQGKAEVMEEFFSELRDISRVARATLREASVLMDKDD